MHTLRQHFEAQPRTAHAGAPLLLMMIFSVVLAGCVHRDLAAPLRVMANTAEMRHRKTPVVQVAGDPNSLAEVNNIRLVANWTDDHSLEPDKTTLQPPGKTILQPLDLRNREVQPRQGNDGQVTANQPNSERDPNAEELPRPRATQDGGQQDSTQGSTLSLDTVLRSIAESFPPLDVALAELAAAEGKALSKWGGFDTKLHAHSISGPLGFYQTYRNGFGAKQPLWNGGEVYGGYRIGRGNFQPWFGERQTNDGGEFKTGIKQPLFQNYAIDERRADLEIAQLERLRLEPDIQTRILEIQRMASRMYWDWVAAGQIVEVSERLLELAEDRAENIEDRVDEGDLPRLALVDNGRFIAKRQATLIKAQRSLEKVAIKLSLFYRDALGSPIVANAEQLPEAFPEATSIAPEAVEADIANAIAARPEIRELDFQRRQVSVELCQAQNEILPKVDAFAEASQDVGGPSSSKRDKSPFELELGVLAEVPLQRRKAVGRVQAAEAKLAQIAAKRVFVEDKIRTQVLDAVSALNRAYQSIERAKENLELSRESVRLGQASFEEGDIDIIELNIRETALAEAALLLNDAEFAYFAALADYRASLGIVELP